MEGKCQGQAGVEGDVLVPHDNYHIILTSSVIMRFVRFEVLMVVAIRTVLQKNHFCPED